MILGKLPTLNVPIKRHPSLWDLVFSDVILVSTCHGCKEETINLISHYLIDIIYKTVKWSHLEKLQIIQNINKVMFQVIFTFSDWILIKQIIVSSTPLILGKENRFSKCYTCSFHWKTEAWVKMLRFNVFSRNVNTINWRIVLHMMEYKSQRIFNKHSGER